MKIVLWILGALVLSVLCAWMLYQPAAEEVTSSHPAYIPAYNGTSTNDTPRKPQTQTISVIAGFLLFLGLMLFFLPMFLACNRDHPNAVPITLVNVLLGWTFLGWVVALVWSCSATSSSSASSVQPRATALPVPAPQAIGEYY